MAIEILKSSAGAGKTFNLAKTYIRLLLQDGDPYSYRHILAVTFTNKATAEMKGRILKELDILATKPEKSPYIKEFAGEFGGKDVVQRRASSLLRLVLNDYGAFSVSTIDKFIQTALRSFAREMGRFPNYQIELDRESLVKESVDAILDSLGKESDKELRGWLLAGALDQIDETGSLHLESGLYKMAGSIGNDDYRQVVEDYGIDTDKAYSRENLDALQLCCRKITDEFKGRVKQNAVNVISVINSCGFSLDDFSKASNFTLKFPSYAEGKNISKPTEAFLKRCHEQDKMFTKEMQKKVGSTLEMSAGTIASATGSFAELFEGKDYRVFQTARLIASQIYNLGLEGEFKVGLDKLMKEKNVLSIDASNLLLREIIAGSDAPFVYEKMGVRYEHFLLDEFQDTSAVQWENFKPLLLESAASGNFNFIVGDVKQSIYRWRGGDWMLLASEAGEYLHEYAYEAPSLVQNWRSLQSIVGYNNDFFAFAAGVLDNEFSARTGAKDYSQARDIYADVRQQAMTSNPQKGFVEVNFCEKDEVLDKISLALDHVFAAGASFRDIAILVRNKKEGSLVASYLSEKGLPVISDDSMRVKSSAMVRRLTALLAVAANSEDPVGGFIARSLGVGLPGQNDSLFGFAEELLRALRVAREEDFNKEVIYIQAFMDTLLEWSSANGNSIPAFLEYWKAQDPKLSSPEGTEAIRVTTIHKSKGLEYPVVIFPFAETVKLFEDERKWCCPKVEGTRLEEFGRNAYNINVSSKLSDSLFDKYYLRELRLQLIDNLNLFYVAMTRAVKVLYVIAGRGTGEVSKLSTMADVLYLFEKSSTTDHGCMYDFNKAPSELPAVEAVGHGYPSYPLNFDGGDDKDDVRIRGRLKFRSDAVDFFSPEGQTGILASARLKGIVLHKILSMCKVAGDLPGAIDNACASGLLELGMREEYGSFLGKALEDASVKGWFAPGLRVLDEAAVIDTDGQLYRPDRVVIDPSGKSVTVIDYKFGSAKPSYRRQVANYCRLYRDMGYPDVSGWLWYVGDGVTERVV